MHYHGGGGVVGNNVNTGVDLSADYHVYGMEYIPGQSIKMYLDGVLRATYTQNIPTGAYEILINLQVAGSQAAGWPPWREVAASLNSMLARCRLISCVS